MADPSPLSQYRSAQSLDRVCTEDTLKYLHECEYEGERQPATVEGVAGVLNRSLNETVDLLKRMRQAGLVSLQGSAVGMTDEGRSYARQVIRAGDACLGEHVRHSADVMHGLGVMMYDFRQAIGVM